ncbi:MAG TPA: hypothetical protein VMT47_16630 [Polyangia bacterium]|nr:hypothetical protein [Polyangia bacterium]
MIGSFTYDLRSVDDEPADPKRGKYWRAGMTAFSLAVATPHVAGSGRSIGSSSAT